MFKSLLNKCLLENKHYCGHKDNKGYCTKNRYCFYRHTIDKYVLKNPKKSTIETIISLEQNLRRCLSLFEILAITPVHEIKSEFNIIVDRKNNIYNYKKHKLINKELRTW